VSILILGLIAGLAAVSAQSQDGPVTFDLGDPQGIVSMSPLVGVLVPDYEAWNLQYATLTDKAAKDFSTVPGLAESWKGSKDKRTWTYQLRDGLKWSDGAPLTSEDIAWTINMARKEEWLNHSAVVQNLTASAPDPTTVVIETSVPDPAMATTGWRPVSARARRTAAMVDSVPELVKRQWGSLKRLASSSATTTASPVGAPKCVPCVTRAWTAAVIAGCACPCTIAPKPLWKSTYSWPSSSHTRDPSPCVM
jgi:hypothetical protein